MSQQSHGGAPEGGKASSERIYVPSIEDIERKPRDSYTVTMADLELGEPTWSASSSAATRQPTRYTMAMKELHERPPRPTPASAPTPAPVSSPFYVEEAATAPKFSQLFALMEEEAALREDPMLVQTAVQTGVERLRALVAEWEPESAHTDEMKQWREEESIARDFIKAGEDAWKEFSAPFVINPGAPTCTRCHMERPVTIAIPCMHHGYCCACLAEIPGTVYEHNCRVCLRNVGEVYHDAEAATTVLTTGLASGKQSSSARMGDTDILLAYSDEEDLVFLGSDDMDMDAV